MPTRFQLSNSQLDFMISAARTASSNAYCPYSRFPVGAALLTSQGSIFSGCNVENASSGLTICAERSAACQAVTNGQRSFQAIVVYTPTLTPTAPCGACRQVLNEFGNDMLVVCVCNSDQRIETTLEELLPMAFGPQNLANSRPAQLT